MRIKKLLSSLLAIVLILSVLSIIPLTAFAETNGYYTYTVSNGKATITKANTSIISGNVDIPSKLGGYTVTSIGVSAFSGFAKLTSITIPDSVISISDKAFYGCSKLTSVKIGNSVTSIGLNAFSYCTSLTSVTIPGSVTSIGSYAFDGCTGLSSITIPNSVIKIGNCAFGGCSSLEEISLPFVGEKRHKKTDTYQYPFGYIFGESRYTGGTATKQYYYGVSNLSTTSRTYYIPSSLKKVTITDCNYIQYGAFHNCTRLTSITIPNSVTLIGSFAFYGCSGLTSITIPDSATSINYRAFEGCTGLTSITIPDSVTSIGTGAFSGCIGLTSITIPDSVTSIGDYVFSDCPELESITVNSGNTVYHSKGNCLIETESKTLILGCKNSVIPTDESVTSIGNYAFDGCSKLTSIAIPDSVSSIGLRAFYNTGYYNDESNWKKGVLFIGNHLIKAKKDALIGDYIMNENTKTIANYAFEDCTGLTSITIPDSVTSIGKGTFYGCAGLMIITIPNSVTSIGNRVFFGCTGLTSIIIPDSVNSIAESAFNGCTGLTSITIPDSVTSIGNSAFRGCAELESITVNSGNTVYHSAGNCLVETESKTLILGCKNSTIPTDGSVTAINDGAFYGCTGLTTIIIPDFITSVGASAFNGCTGLEIVYYCGTAEEWKMISIATNNTYFTSARVIYHNYIDGICTICKEYAPDVYFLGECGDESINYFWNKKLYISGSGATDNWKTKAVVPWYDYAEQIKEVIIDENITKIGNYAFYCLNSLESVICKNKDLEFGRYIFNTANGNITVYAQSGTAQNYCQENGIRFINVTAMPELESYTENSITIKAISGYEYSKDGENWQTSGIFGGLSPATEYNIYARFADRKDYFLGEVSVPLMVTTKKMSVSAPAAPDYLSHTANSITVIGHTAYEYSIDGEHWQTSATFNNLTANTIYRIYARVAETDTEYASEKSKPLIIAIPDKPQMLKTTGETITIKRVAGFEYCLDDFVWQDSPIFNMLIENEEYNVYQRLKAISGEKTYQIISESITVTAESTHIAGDINNDGEVNNKDLTRLFQYLSNWEVEINEAALDVNNDGAVNNKDLTRLFQYLSDWDVNIF